MKRLSKIVLLVILTLVLCSCEKNVDFFKKEPPEIPNVFRSETVIDGGNVQIKAVTDLKADGTVEFLISEHETLNGLTFRSTPTGFEMTADGMTVAVKEENLPDGAIFSTLGKALRAISKTVVEPVALEGFFEYSYPEFGFVMRQNAVSGEISSVEFKNTGYTVKFVN